MVSDGDRVGPELTIEELRETIDEVLGWGPYVVAVWFVNCPDRHERLMQIAGPIRTTPSMGFASFWGLRIYQALWPIEERPTIDRPGIWYEWSDGRVIHEDEMEKPGKETT